MLRYGCRSTGHGESSNHGRSDRGFWFEAEIGGLLDGFAGFCFLRLDGINGWSDESNSKTYIKARESHSWLHREERCLCVFRGKLHCDRSECVEGWDKEIGTGDSLFL